MNEPSWWKGPRGEWYVVVQMVLVVLVAVGPRSWRGAPGFPASAVPVAGWTLLSLGGIFVLAGSVTLGSRLTALPYPAGGAVLRQTGAFCVVRHPMYCGAILAALGWSAVRQGWLTLGFAALLFLLFDRKARREEAWLLARFPEYADYQRRVRKLIPFLY